MMTKEFGAKVPQELYEEFRHLFPQYGATTWFINESLKSFLDLVRDDEVVQRGIAISIDEMLQENREHGNDDSTRAETGLAERT